jgi:hypothetical protein
MTRRRLSRPNRPAAPQRTLALTALALAPTNAAEIEVEVMIKVDRGDEGRSGW